MRTTVNGVEFWHKRLPDWEPFDEMRFKVIPRYKTSGLSGDEWRQHVQVEFLHKGKVVHEAGFRDMATALRHAPVEMDKATCPIPEEVIKLERGLCDQPSCQLPPIGRLAIKRETSDRGDWLDPAHAYGRKYRQFCSVHIQRGDCSREDCDDNYEPLDSATASASTNVQESPSILGAVIELAEKPQP